MRKNGREASLRERYILCLWLIKHVDEDCIYLLKSIHSSIRIRSTAFREKDHLSLIERYSHVLPLFAKVAYKVSVGALGIKKPTHFNSDAGKLADYETASSAMHS